MTVISDLEKQVRERLAELKPLVDEYHQLEAVLESFGQPATKASGSEARPAKRTRGAKRATRGGRSDEAMRLVSENPGVTVADLAERMGIGPTYLYRVLPALERDGKVRKVGKGYEAVE